MLVTDPFRSAARTREQKLSNTPLRTQPDANCCFEIVEGADEKAEVSRAGPDLYGHRLAGARDQTGRLFGTERAGARRTRNESPGAMSGVVRLPSPVHPGTPSKKLSISRPCQ